MLTLMPVERSNCGSSASYARLNPPEIRTLTWDTRQRMTCAIASATYSMFFELSAATQMRPVSMA